MIYLGTDHRGFEQKEAIKDAFFSNFHEFYLVYK